MESNPPKWANRFLQWYCNPELLEEIQGDAYELFDRRLDARGKRMARYAFIWDVLRFCRWTNIKRTNSKYIQMNKALLFRNYLKLGFRTIRKNMVSSSINIFGLAVAIGFAITTFVFVDMQLNMDRFHSKGDRIYQLTNYVQQEGKDQQRWGDSPLLLAPQVAADNPSVEAFARMEFQLANVRHKTEVFEELITFVDPVFMEMFDYPLLTGSKQVLYDKTQIAISRNMAIKYFSDQDPIGQELSLKFSNGTIKRFKVGTVLDKAPYNSSLNEDIFISIDHFFDLKLQDHYDWSYMTDATFLLLKEGESIASISKFYPEYIELQHGSNPDWKIEKFEPIPLYELSKKAFKTRGSVSGGGHPGGRIALIFISSFLLAMACFNFMNIAVVGAAKRLKEIALRKVMGGLRRQIINQFLVENVLQCLFALIAGILIAYLLLVPGFDALVPQMDIQFRAYSPLSMGAFLVILLVLVGLLSGAYPALYISKFESITIFKGNLKFGSKNVFSKLMLGFQFFLAIMTIISCFVFTDQSIDLGKRDWGYDPSGTLSVWVADNEQYEKLRNKVAQHPDVLTFAASTRQIGRSLPLKSLEYEDKQLAVRSFGATGDYFETLRLRLQEGRFLTDQTNDQESAVVVNETLVRQLGWTPTEAINKTFMFDSVRRTVVGVIDDFHYYDFYSAIDPVIIHGLDETEVSYLSIRTKPNSLIGIEEYTRKAWQEIAPNDPFDRVFQEDAFDDFYRENKANITIMLFISVVAIILACLGLYGLLSYNIQAKLKEFSIRKVLGATPKTIATIAGKQYIWIVLIAFALGAPLGYWGINQLILDIFPNPGRITAMPFIIAIGSILLTMFITVMGQVLKAIKVNPVENLRNE